MNKGHWLTAVVLLTGCTNREIYHAIQQNRQNECAVLRTPQYEECMENHSLAYDEYIERRDEIFQRNQMKAK